MSKDDKKDQSKKKKPSTDGLTVQEYKLVPVEHSGSEIEIDLIKSIKTIWDNRTTIYKFLGAGFVFGILVVLLSPKEYVSSATLMPEYSTEASGGGASDLIQKYGGLIGLSGGTYNSTSNAIRVDLYPQIVQSITFQQKLAEQEFYFPEEDTLANFLDYYQEIKYLGFLGYISEYTIGLPGKIIEAIFSNNDSEVTTLGTAKDHIKLSKDDMKVIENLRSRVNASLNQESGIISVSAKMGNPDLAADVAKFTIEELTAYLIEYRTEKVLRDLDFIADQLTKAETRFKKAQLTLAEFRDTHQGNLTARAQTEEQQLNSEYDLAFNLYNSFTQQYEEARLKVQEQTPVFKTLQPVQVPVNDEMSGAMVLIVFIMVSGLIGIVWIFSAQILKNYPFESHKT